MGDFTEMPTKNPPKNEKLFLTKCHKLCERGHFELFYTKKKFSAIKLLEKNYESLKLRECKSFLFQHKWVIQNTGRVCILALDRSTYFSIN